MEQIVRLLLTEASPSLRSLPKLASARKQAVQPLKATADRHAANVLPVIQEVRKAGATTLVPSLMHSTPVVSRPLAVANGSLPPLGTCWLVRRRG